MQLGKLASKIQILSNGHILARPINTWPWFSFLNHQSIKWETNKLRTQSILSFIYSSSFEPFKFNSYKSSSERDIVVKALFVYPSQKGELSLWEKSQTQSIINCIKRVGVTLVRCEGDFSPCEEE
jgi:hypothetical protein